MQLIREVKQFFGDAGFQPFGYTGYQKEEAGGLYYAQARRYDADTGRFISEDKVKGNGYFPTTINTYLYCRNHPMRYIDPSGNDCYIFYSEGSKSNAKKEKKQLKKQYGLKGSQVHLIEVSSNDEFGEAWNSMGMEDGEEVSIDAVSIFLHGNTEQLQYKRSISKEDDRLSGDVIQGLDEKDMNILVIYGCNAGNLDYADTNPAYGNAFIIKIIFLYGRKNLIADCRVWQSISKGERFGFMNKIKKILCVILGMVYLLFDLGIFMVIRTNLLPLSLVNLFVEAIINIILSTILLFFLWYGGQILLKIKSKTFFLYLLSGTFLSWIGCIVCMFVFDAIAAIVGGVYLFCVIGMSVMICLCVIKKWICVIEGMICFLCIERMYAVFLDEYGLFIPYVGKTDAILLICLLSLVLLLLMWTVSCRRLQIQAKKWGINVILGGYFSLFFWPANNFFSAGADWKLKIEYLLFFLTIPVIICCSIAGFGKLCKERE